MHNKSLNFNHRENFLMNLLQKIIHEYKSLLEYTRKINPFKILKILYLSPVPGETRFLIQVSNKDVILKLTAAEIIHDNYDLDGFPGFHADMIRHAAKGSLMEFLKIDHNSYNYKIISKKYDRDHKNHIFTLETTDQLLFNATTEELSKNKDTLNNLKSDDVFDIGYTQATESIIKENIVLKPQT